MIGLRLMEKIIYNTNLKGFYGSDLVISDDSTSLYISDTYQDAQYKNSVQIYKKSKNSWLRSYEIFPLDRTESISFGCSLSLTKDNRSLFIGAKTDSQGSVYVYRKTIDNFEYSQKLIGPTSSRLFGYKLACSPNGEYLAVAYRINSVGKISVYKKNINTYTLHQTLEDILSVQNNLGYELKFDEKGQTLIASSFSSDKRGQIFVYLLNDGVFKETQRLSLQDIKNNDQFGNHIDINEDGTKILVSYKRDLNLYVFEKENTIYLLKNKILLNFKISNDVFGIGFIDNGLGFYSFSNKEALKYKLNVSSYKNTESYSFSAGENISNYINRYNGDFCIGDYLYLNKGRVLFYNEAVDLYLYNGTNQKDQSTSFSIKALTHRAVQEVYLENSQSSGWLSYYLDPITISGSGSYPLNFKDLNAFSIDFERNIMGELDGPFLFYREYSGEQNFICPTVASPCSMELCVICQAGITAYNQGKLSLNIPFDFKAKVLFFDRFDFGPSVSGIYDSILINDKFNGCCCGCDCDKIIAAASFKQKDELRNEKRLVLDGIDSIFWADTEKLEYNLTRYGGNYFSGQIGVNNFTEGDKIVFKQYQYDYDKAYRLIYDKKPIYTEYRNQYIYSKTITGDNYFSGKFQLISLINNTLNINHNTWLPLKQSATPFYKENPLLIASDGGVDASGNNLINIKSQNPGKLGAYDISLISGPKLQIYNYLVPELISLQVYNDGINWENIVSSRDVQPINVYLKNNKSIGPKIKYEEIENTKSSYDRSIPIGSEKETLPQNTGSLSGLQSGINKVNNRCAMLTGAGEIECIPSEGQSGECCGSGYADFYAFSCKDREEQGPPEDGQPQTPEEELPGKKNPSRTEKIELERFRLGFWNYLKNEENFNLQQELNPNLPDNNSFIPNESINYEELKSYKNNKIISWPPIVNEGIKSPNLNLIKDNSICEQAGYFSAPYVNCPSGYNSLTIIVQGQNCYDCRD